MHDMNEEENQETEFCDLNIQNGITRYQINMKTMTENRKQFPRKRKLVNTVD